MASVLLAAGAAQAQDGPLWMRYPAISPDGKTIAFTYCGDIFTVPADGGRATQLTTHPAHDTRPVWSPDGRQIAFASDRNGGFDVFIMSRYGGAPTRLTTHSANEYPETFADSTHVLFSASIQQDYRDIQFPGGQFSQIYSVPTSGGRPVMFSSMVMQNLSLDKSGGRLLYHDMKGYEDNWRKHHRSSITRDIWMCTLGENRSYRKLTSFRGEDRNPVWAPDGDSFYYLSEENGSFNVYKYSLSDGNHSQVTQHTKNPVRFLTVADNGTLCYGYDGEIYTMREGAQPSKVKVEIVTDRVENDVLNRTFRSGATDMAVSPNGKEVAFIVRGDVYVTSVDYETTRQITNTPQQERNISFSPDGRSLVYSAERDSVWGIYQSSLVRKEDKYFTYAQELKNPYFAHRMEGILTQCGYKLSGVLNGIDMKLYDPAADGRITANYTAEDLSGKAADKTALQNLMGLNEEPNTPIIAMVSRLVSHKGLDLLREVMGDIMELPAQFVVLGSGDAGYEEFFRRTAERGRKMTPRDPLRPGRLAAQKLPVL